MQVGVTELQLSLSTCTGTYLRVEYAKTLREESRSYRGFRAEERCIK